MKNDPKKHIKQISPSMGKWLPTSPRLEWKHGFHPVESELRTLWEAERMSCGQYSSIPHSPQLRHLISALKLPFPRQTTMIYATCRTEETFRVAVPPPPDERWQHAANADRRESRNDWSYKSAKETRKTKTASQREINKKRQKVEGGREYYRTRAARLRKRT